MKELARPAGSADLFWPSVMDAMTNMYTRKRVGYDAMNIMIAAIEKAGGMG